MNDELRAVKFLIDIIHTDLTELAEAVRLYGENDFRRGQLYAFAECPEVLQLFPAFRSAGLDYDIERRSANQNKRSGASGHKEARRGFRRAFALELLCFFVLLNTRLC